MEVRRPSLTRGSELFGILSIDPDVLLSALIAPGGTSDQALRAAATRTVAVVSPRLLDRFLQRASQEQFRRWFTTTDVRELADRLRDFSGTVPDPEQVLASVPDDPSDDYLVALARHAEAQRLRGSSGWPRSPRARHLAAGSTGQFPIDK